MDATEKPDTRISSECCTYYKTSSGGPGWPHRCRRWLATANNASNMEALMPKHQCNPSLPLLPLELLHIDFMRIEMTIELYHPPNVVSILVFCDYFMKHFMAYMTPNQTAKAVAKFLWQGYNLIFGTLAKLLSDNFESNIIKVLCELMGI